MSIGTIPVIVKSDAAARVAELGMQPQFEAMLEHARQTIPDLKAMLVSLVHDPCPDVEPGIVIWAQREELLNAGDSTDWDYAGWKVRTFPPEVCLHFSFISVDGDINEG